MAQFDESKAVIIPNELLKSVNEMISGQLLLLDKFQLLELDVSKSTSHNNFTRIVVKSEYI